MVFPRVRSQVSVIVQANTVDDLINQPDQAEGFAQDMKRCVIISLLLKLMIGTGRVLTTENPIRQLHVFPLPSARVAGFTGREETPHFDDLPSALLHLRIEEAQKFAKRGV